MNQVNKIPLLLHTCCAPCSLMPYKYLKDEFDITFFFYNPNIHPEEEFIKRRDVFIAYMQEENLKYIVDEKYYGFDAWSQDFPTLSYPERCSYCYIPRLEESAKKAKELNISHFTTSLLYSRFQKIDIIFEQGIEIAKKYSLDFLNRDFRPYWNEGIDLSKEKKLYRQKYCGCGLPYK